MYFEDGENITQIQKKAWNYGLL